MWGQTAPQPLNLKLPSDDATTLGAPVQHATAAPERSAKATAALAAQAQAPVAAALPSASANSTVETRYDAAANQAVDAADAAREPVDAQDTGKPTCNDAAYAQPQVHGSVGMGVVAGNHLSGNYQTGGVQVTKALGSCDHPAGGVSVSVNVSRGSFGGGRGWH